MHSLVKTSVFLLTASLISTETFAADHRKNPFSFVYEGAITENQQGKVNLQTVSYQLNHINIAANVYTPPNYTPTKKYPAIVIAHPNGGVKEQVAGLYAQRLAEQGYITIVADAAYQGASGGEPRNIDKPANRIEDIHGMADFISTFKGVDINHIGLLGICGGGGYALKAAQTDKRFQSVATLSLFNSGRVRRNGYMDSSLDTIQKRLQLASAARQKEALTGEVSYVADAQLSEEQITALPFDLYRQGYEYYGKTHVHPNATFRYTQSSLLALMNFDAVINIDLINQPLLMVAGSKADSLYMTEEAYQLATGSESKQLYLIAGATHIETYWQPSYVEQAMRQFTDFFANTLKLNKTVNQQSTSRAEAVLIETTEATAKSVNITPIEINQGGIAVFGANDKFTGVVKITSAFVSPVASNYRGAMVKFAANARTAWHTHPKGQTLIVISGKGLIQSEGSEVQQMFSGNVITIPANTRHWHGAATDSAMSHIAISTPDNGETVTWL